MQKRIVGRRSNVSGADRGCVKASTTKDTKVHEGWECLISEVRIQTAETLRPFLQITPSREISGFCSERGAIACSRYGGAERRVPPEKAFNRKGR